MSGSKHTPGPWVAWNVPSAGWQIGTKRQSERPDRFYGNIASIAFYQMRPGSDGGPFYTEANAQADEADAKLMAGAPEMYEALKELVECLSGNADSMMGLRSAGAKAIAALAKAEGRG